MTAVAAAIVVTLSLTLGPASAPTAHLRSEQKVAAGYNQGIARVDGGWILSGTIVLARVDERLHPVKSVSLPIPPALRVKGYNRSGSTCTRRSSSPTTRRASRSLHATTSRR